MDENLQKEIMFEIGRSAETKIFRNNTGTGWQGKRMNGGNNTIIIQNPRPLAAGLCVGSSDLIGWTSVEVTPEMIGTRIAVFTAVEVKRKNDRPTPEQLNFIEVIKNAGGFAGIARSIEDAKKIINPNAK